MEESETIERSHVTDLSVQELLELGAIDEDEVEKYEERITISESRPQTTPTDRSFTETTQRWVQSVLSGSKDYVTDKVVPFFRRLVHSQTKKTMYGVIEKLNPTETGIELVVQHPDEKDSKLLFSQDSQQYSTLLSYYNTTNPLDLKGEKLIKKSNKNICAYYIPHNVSLSGRLRYKLFGYLSTISNVLKRTPDLSQGKLIVGLGVATLGALTVFGIPLSMMEPVLEEMFSDRTILALLFVPMSIFFIPFLLLICKDVLRGLLQIPLKILYTEEYNRN